MNIKQYCEIGENLTKNKTYQIDELIGLFAVNYYHLLDLLWQDTGKEPTESYACYLYCNCMGYFAMALKKDDIENDEGDAEIESFESQIRKQGLTTQEYILRLLLEVDTSPTSGNTPIMAKIATLNIIMRSFFPQRSEKGFMIEVKN